jgi:DNA-binding CsgD family transcriptional regulator
MDKPIASVSGEKSYLTKREWDCVKLGMSGKTAKEVARELRISSRTVEVHLSQARRKFNTKNRMELFCQVFKILTKANL